MATQVRVGRYFIKSFVVAHTFRTIENTKLIHRTQRIFVGDKNNFYFTRMLKGEAPRHFIFLLHLKWVCRISRRSFKLYVACNMYVRCALNELNKNTLNEHVKCIAQFNLLVVHRTIHEEHNFVLVPSDSVIFILTSDGSSNKITETLFATLFFNNNEYDYITITLCHFMKLTSTLECAM